MRKTELYFDSISDEFRDRMNPVDLSARLSWFEQSLTNHPRPFPRLVDVGAGLGQCSLVAQRHGAQVVPVDIAPKLVRRLRNSFPNAIQASAVELPFASSSVDLVVSSECVEHTPDPRRAILEMLRILKPDGVLFLPHLTPSGDGRSGWSCVRRDCHLPAPWSQSGRARPSALHRRRSGDEVASGL